MKRLPLAVTPAGLTKTLAAGNDLWLFRTHVRIWSVDSSASPLIPVRLSCGHCLFTGATLTSRQNNWRWNERRRLGELVQGLWMSSKNKGHETKPPKSLPTFQITFHNAFQCRHTQDITVQANSILKSVHCVGPFVNFKEKKNPGETTTTRKPTWEAALVKDATWDKFPQWLKAKQWQNVQSSSELKSQRIKTNFNDMWLRPKQIFPNGYD